MTARPNPCADETLSAATSFPAARLVLAGVATALFATLNAGTAHAANGYCRALPYADEMPEVFGACYVWEGSPEGAVIAFDGEWGRNPEGAREARLADTRTAITETLGFYSRLVSLPSPLLVYVTDEPYSPDDVSPALYAFNARKPSELNGPCWVGVTPLGFESERAKYMQTLAHELGHCMIDDYTGSISANEEEEQLNKVWYEGVAEYLSNQVFVTSDNEDEYVRAYDSSLDIFAYEYVNVSFFQHYGNRRGGPRAVMELARELANHGDLRNFLPVLTAKDGMAEFWHDFGTTTDAAEISDRSVWGTDGTLPASKVAFFADDPHLTPETGSGSLTLAGSGEAETFSFYLQEISLAKRGIYTLEPPATTSGEIRGSLDRDGSWIPMADAVTIKTCEEDELVGVLLSITSDDYITPEPTLAYSGEPNPECGGCIDTGRKDPCLVGAWELDDSRLDSFVRSQFLSRRRPDDIDAPTREVSSKGWVRADGTGRFLSKMRLVTSLPGDPNAALSITTESQSDVQSTWSTGDGQLYNCRESGFRRVVQTMDAFDHDPETGASETSRQITEFRDGELVDISGFVRIEPPRDADAEKRAEVRANERERNRELNDGRLEARVRERHPYGLPDPWMDSSPVPYTCSGDTLIIEATPVMDVGAGERGRFTVPPMQFTFRRTNEAEPP